MLVPACSALPLSVNWTVMRRLAGFNVAETVSDTTDYCAQFGPMHTEFKAFASICTFVWAAWVIAASDICTALAEGLD